MAKPVIVRNSVRCKLCGDEIESTHRHDFRSCSCGAVYVDGGHDYLRRVWDASGNPEDIFEDTSICTHRANPYITPPVCTYCGASL